MVENDTPGRPLPVKAMMGMRRIVDQTKTSAAASIAVNPLRR